MKDKASKCCNKGIRMCTQYNLFYITSCNVLYTRSLQLQVLEQGRIVEFDVPYLLLNKRDGFLSKMVHQMGASEADHVTEEARRVYELNTNAVLHEETAIKETRISFYLPHDDLRTVEDTGHVNMETKDTRL